MIHIIEKNKLYFVLYFCFFITLFYFQLTQEQLEAIFFFDRTRTNLLNAFFKFWTLLGEAYPFILLTIYFIIKKENIKSLLVATTGVVILIPIFLFKEYFTHPRPLAVIEAQGLQNQIHLVEGADILRGFNSFPSGHTAAAFAVWTLLALLFPNILPRTLFFFVSAVLVGISRIYLVAHFPQDVLFGSSIGIFTAIGMVYLFEKVTKQPLL